MGRELRSTTIVILTGVLAWMTLVPAARAAEEKQIWKLEDATAVYTELMEAPDRAAPHYLVERAKCVAVIPSIVKGALGVGGHHGKGVLTCRSDAGEWSAPVFLEVSGGSVGFQIGLEATDLVLFFITRRGVESLLRSKITLGADATVAGGPLGRSAEASTDLKLKAEIYAYAKSKGLFAGVSVEGARLAPDPKANRRYYGNKIDPRELLFDGVTPPLRPEAKRFLAVLP